MRNRRTGVSDRLLVAPNIN